MLTAVAACQLQLSVSLRPRMTGSGIVCAARSPPHCKLACSIAILNGTVSAVLPPLIPAKLATKHPEDESAQRISSSRLGTSLA